MRPLTDEQIGRIKALRAAGRSYWSIKAETGHSISSVIKFGAGVVQVDCSCGRRANHNGACVARPHSAVRLAAYAELGEKRRRWTDEANEFLRVEWQRGTADVVIVRGLMERFGLSFSTNAVRVQACLLKVRRVKGANPQKRAARLAYWAAVRAGERCQSSNLGRPRKAAPAVVAPVPVAEPAPVLIMDQPVNGYHLTARAAPAPKPKAPFSMLATRGPDPNREAWLAAKARGGLGRV